MLGLLAGMFAGNRLAMLAWLIRFPYLGGAFQRLSWLTISFGAATRACGDIDVDTDFLPKMAGAGLRSAKTSNSLRFLGVRGNSMRGEVLHYDDEQGFGFINGADGKRYAFERSDLRRLVPVGKGTVVEFQIDGATAREIFIIRSDTRASAPASFGRDAVVAEPESTGIWSYFIRTLTSNYANFRGRARRKEYWGYVLFYRSC